MKPTLVGRDTLHELDQPLKKLAYVSNHWGPLLFEWRKGGLAASMIPVFMDISTYQTP
jgi:hypothetical protein